MDPDALKLNGLTGPAGTQFIDDAERIEIALKQPRVRLPRQRQARLASGAAPDQLGARHFLVTDRITEFGRPD
ncbi:MAG: hypothetical protein JOY90_13335 [Bradyrhizobium sp.]|uniref:hypothetical protein n=1 Tax=Bradyrhizobium sp. TaxID=376 RepID=UPI001E0FC02A|nr:hypothetical protein [Bradyrhizobium sp.]MBV9561412.1 hypothetical protein [Bradyrhizobium sp.]